jgi:hypothetical protein
MSRNKRQTVLTLTETRNLSTSRWHLRCASQLWDGIRWQTLANEVAQLIEDPDGTSNEASVAYGKIGRVCANVLSRHAAMEAKRTTRAGHVTKFQTSRQTRAEKVRTKKRGGGISLIIEIPFMIATYDQSERRERAAERRARGEPDNLPGKVSSLIFWCLLALVNVVGQISFLAFITHAGLSLTDPSVVGLWFFIIFQVTGVIVGDCYTAFHLLPTEASTDRVLRAQQAQVEGEQRLAISDAERLRKDAEAKQAVRRVELSVQRVGKSADAPTGNLSRGRAGDG